MFEGISQPMYLLVILIICQIVFGPPKLPALGSAFGKAIKGFKKAMAEPEEKAAGVAEPKKSKT